MNFADKCVLFIEKETFGSIFQKLFKLNLLYRFTRIIADIQCEQFISSIISYNRFIMCFNYFPSILRIIDFHKIYNVILTNMIVFLFIPTKILIKGFILKNFNN